MRVGLIVPRFRHTAVARNQLKRRLRELTRLQLLTAGLPLDVVIRTRPEAYDASFDQLRVDIARTLTQLARSSAP
jgi:ribonuclease P protein component